MIAALTARAIKVTLVVAPAGVLDILLRDGAPAPSVAIEAGGRTLHATFSPKSLRRAQAAIRAAGPDGVAVVVQGNLGPGDEVLEAGINAQPKTPAAARPAEAVP